MLNADVYGKIETGNPTGSHKDRETLKMIPELMSKGHESVGCASTGNAAISLAAYSRMIGIRCHIYISKNVSQERMNLIQMFSPRIHVLEDEYREAVEQSNLEMHEKGIYNANSGVLLKDRRRLCHRQRDSRKNPARLRSCPDQQRNPLCQSLEGTQGL